MTPPEKVLLTYDIPPLRGLNWQILESEPGDPPGWFAAHHARTASSVRGWSVKTVKINPAVADLPAHLAQNGHDYCPLPDATAAP